MTSNSALVMSHKNSAQGMSDKTQEFEMSDIYLIPVLNLLSVL